MWKISYEDKTQIRTLWELFFGYQNIWYLRYNFWKKVVRFAQWKLCVNALMSICRRWYYQNKATSALIQKAAEVMIGISVKAFKRVNFTDVKVFYTNTPKTITTIKMAESNSLPIDIRNTDCLSTFRSKLKTHFFTASYTWRDIPTVAPLYLVSRQTIWRSTNLIFICYVMLWKE